MATMDDDGKLLQYLKRVTAELHQTRRRLHEVESADRDPIAIVAMSCRYPGGVTSPEELWRLVVDEVDAIGPFPTDRGWTTGPLPTGDEDGPADGHVREGGFLADPAGFDAELFEMSPREALATDPQQRIMLELAWETFERAGLAPDSLDGAQVGVFVGSGAQDYYDDLSAAATEAVSAYFSTGNAASVISSRISYAFGLAGPALTIDTACSSSLVALHVAAQALRQRECSMALAGGVMVMATPGPFVAFSKQRGLASDGRCKPFSDDADGTGWAEGAGVLLLERLSDAQRNGHPVLAVIRGSAVNQDGASNGLTAPNGLAQQRVIRQALTAAGLSTVDVDVVEAHGTGTRLGDPIEAQALLATYGRGRDADRPLWLGSLKSNIGHAQAAAGVGGVIKMVMALRAGVLPRSLHVSEPSSHVDWSAGGVRLLTRARPWPGTDEPRRAGVSSFGVSGTNAHLILEQAEPAGESGTGDTDLPQPTRRFHRKRYWLDDRAPAGDLATVGLDPADHPLLAAVTVVADTQGAVLTGRLSTATHPWLAEHRVHGEVILPGTAFVELAVRAADQLGCAHIAELTLHAPMRLPAHGGVRIQVVVGEPDQAGARRISIHSRAEQAVAARSWTSHATGHLTTAPIPSGADQPEAEPSWPPAGAEPVPIDTLDDTLAGAGLDYGPAFRGLRAVWRQGVRLWADVRLPDPGDADRFGLHPAVLDAATQALAVDLGDGQGHARLPFSWSGVTLHATGAAELRVRFTPTSPDTYAVAAFDHAGHLVATATAVTFRPLAAVAAAPARTADLHRLDWVPIADPGRDRPAEGVHLLRLDEVCGDDPDTIREHCRQLLATLQHWLGDATNNGTRLAVVTRGAVPVAGTGGDLAGAAVWGLVRSAQAEHPDRFLLVDADPVDRTDPSGVSGVAATGDTPADADTVAAAVAAALAAGEPQVAVRGGTAHAARLAHLPAAGNARPVLDPAGTVLITGGPGSLGAIVARHLVDRYAVRHLVLLSRQGDQTPGAAALVAELAELGARARVVACDVADRAALARVLTETTARRPLTAVVHAAGVVADGVVTEMTPHRLDAVLAPKVAGALHLHELTAGMDLAAFVMFSSLSGVLGAPGQANYAAANSVLDALAARRHRAGLPAVSVAWGQWDTDGGMTGTLAEADRARMARGGVLPLSVPAGLALFDAAVAATAPAVVAAALQPARLRAGDGVPPVFSSLVGPLTRPAAGGGTGALAARLAELAERERADLLLDLVRTHVATVLGHESPEAVAADREFHQLGFDSLTAVELRNALTAATGLRLPATLVFDHPTANAVAEYLRAELVVGESRPGGALAVASSAGTDEPIAIVAMACRYPGGVSSPEQLWTLVADGVDAIGEFPADRGWQIDQLYDASGERPGSTYVRTGGFLYDAADFDAGFFGISPREAPTVDPQQRLLLETSWEAVERAGIDPLSLRGSATGVFVGVQYHDYVASSSTGAVVSGRVAHHFGFEGPAVSVDTACSSSLVSMHWAAQSLRTGECTLALAGGVTVMATPETFVEFSRQRGLARDGRCKAFSTDADGTAWAEGAGVLVLERLSDARRHGHPVLAVIRGSAVNSDGRSNGLTAPNGPAQQRVIRQALANAGLRPGDVDVVEAHGTGTALGDPIEAQALLATYGQDRDEPLWLGSLKSNIGHTQAAAGVAGVIKMVQAMRYATMPRTLHVTEPSTHVDWAAGKVRLLTTDRPWRRTGQPRRAAVSSFGVSGTNAHLVIEEADPQDAAVTAGGDGGSAAGSESGGGADGGAGEPPVVPWLLSGRTRQALQAQAERLLNHVDDTDDEAADIGYSTVFRPQLEHRAVLLGAERGDFLLGLVALVDGVEEAESVTGTVSSGGLAFVFSGQGAQHPRMGRQLAARFPVFAAALHEVTSEFDTRLDPPLGTVLAAEPGSAEAALLDQTAYTQAGVFAVEVAMLRLLESVGVRPDRLAGHSIGELAAAYAAGMLSLSDACALVAARGTLMQALPAGGAMLAVQASEDEVRPLLTGRLDLAAVNAAQSVVLSGAEQEIRAVAERFAGQGRAVTRLRVSHAFHSAAMEPMLAAYREVVESVTFRPPRVPLVSTLTGAAADPEQLCSAEYWVRQVREPVRFHDAVRCLERAGVTRFVEVGPDAVLVPLVSRGVAATVAPPTVAPTMRRGRDEPRTLLDTLARLHVCGVAVDWSAVLADLPVRRVPLPTYAFQRQRYWLDSVAGALADPAAGAHPLVDQAVELPGSGGLMLTGRLSTATHPWLADHVVHGLTVLPGAGLVELATRAGDQLGCGRIEQLDFERPLVLPAGGSVAVQVEVGAADEHGARRVLVHSRAGSAGTDPPWQRHASGVLVPDTAAADRLAPDPEFTQWPPPGATPVPLDSWYDELAATAGIAYGPVFRGVRAVWRRADEVYADVALPAVAGTDAADFNLHPAVLDAAWQLVAHSPVAAAGPLLPFAVTGVSLFATGAVEARVRVRVAAPATVSVEIADGAGVPVATVDALALRPAGDLAQALDDVEVSAGDGSAASRDGGGPGDGPAAALLRVQWQPIAAPDVSPSVAWQLVGPDRWTLAAPLTATAVPDFDAVVASAADGDGEDRPVFLLSCGGGPDPDVVHGETRRAVDALRTWLADSRFDGSRLVVVTGGGVPAGAVAGVDPAGAAVWGLVRSAQAEHPDRIVLVDVEPDRVSPALLASAVSTGEPQVAVRDEALYVPRLVPSGPPPQDAPPTPPDFGSGTVLVTGATGALGRVIARHLVTGHGVRHLLLTSRRGMAAPDMTRLRTDLLDLGAQVTVTACDVTDRDEVARLLATVPSEHPLTGVVHAAGVLDDAVIGSLTADRMSNVLRPKVDAAWHLHELTRDTPLAAFVTFSSAAGVLGPPGQANYAAANAYLDGLAAHRRAHDLPAKSLAWGLWSTADEGMGGALTEADLRRLAETGVHPLDAETGLALYDRAVALPDAVLVPIRLDPAKLGPDRPALLDGLAAPPPTDDGTTGTRRRSARDANGGAPTGGGGGRLREQLAGKSRPQAQELLLEMIRSEAAKLLGHPGPEAIEPERAFSELGFDSLAAIGFRNRLTLLTGRQQPATLIFDYPNAAALARQFAADLVPDTVDGGAALPDDEIRAVLSSIPLGRLRAAGLLESLLALAGAPTHPAGTPHPAGGSAIDEMDTENLISMALQTADFGE
ncbi:SDR family NAD(P)-dependent oxidoreductase [Solwaraspora sp. WMMA2080]|uniref:SDR family NAD(P)-dependent oxidoreductase n=1 Tax=unclassified Solwaraspora TaxID=2627926 RepID=UPI0032B12413